MLNAGVPFGKCGKRPRRRKLPILPGTADCEVILLTRTPQLPIQYYVCSLLRDRPERTGRRTFACAAALRTSERRPRNRPTA